MHDNELTSKQYWDQWWSRDTQKVDPLQEHWAEFGRNGFFLRAVERHVGSLNGRSVLELGGCMSNRLLSIAKWRDATVTVVDYSVGGLARTGRLFEDNGCRVELLACD